MIVVGLWPTVQPPAVRGAEHRAGGHEHGELFAATHIAGIALGDPAAGQYLARERQERGIRRGAGQHSGVGVGIRRGPTPYSPLSGGHQSDIHTAGRAVRGLVLRVIPVGILVPPGAVVIGNLPSARAGNLTAIACVAIAAPVPNRGRQNHDDRVLAQRGAVIDRDQLRRAIARRADPRGHEPRGQHSPAIGGVRHARATIRPSGGDKRFPTPRARAQRRGDCGDTAPVWAGPHRDVLHGQKAESAPPTRFANGHDWGIVVPLASRCAVMAPPATTLPPAAVKIRYMTCPFPAKPSASAGSASPSRPMTLVKFKFKNI